MSLLLLIAGCITPSTTDPECRADPRQCHDRDGDGFELRDDCDDADPEVYPGAEEVWYDGKDNDCDPSTLDYEQDQDSDGFPEGSDCDDTNAQVNPGRPETPYDGLDNDCDPETPDNDLDGDGVDSPADCEDQNPDISPAEEEKPYDDVDNDCDETTPDDDLDGDGVGVELDCDDQDDTRSPDYEETPYNGIDDDCDPLTVDDDLDDDGYLLADDCDDQDPDTNPGAIEAFGDGKDNDCDSVTDAVPLQFGGLTWSAPREPVLDSDGQNFLLATSAEGFDDGTGLVDDVGLVLPFDAGTHGSLVWDPILFKNEVQGYPIDGTVDLATTANAFYASVSWYKSSGAENHVGCAEYLWDGTSAYTGTALSHSHSGPGSIPYPALDVDVQLDGDTRWVLACGEEHLHVYTADDSFGSHQIAASSVRYDPGGHTCVLDLQGSTPKAHVCDTTDCFTWDLDPGGDGFTEASSQPWDGWLVDDADVHDGWTILVLNGGGVRVIGPVDSYDLLAGTAVISADASYWDGVLYLIYVLDGGEVYLSWGDPVSPTGWPVVSLDFDDPGRDLLAREAAIHAEGGRLGYAVSGIDQLGGSDALGWAFLGL